jgi:DNA replication protein DnaC
MSVADVLFIDCDGWLREVREAQRSDPEHMAQMQLNVTKTGLLVVDDLTHVDPEGWPFSALRLPLRDRHAKSLPTIVTTNHSPGALSKVDPGLTSRLVSGGVVKFEGPDKRFEK